MVLRQGLKQLAWIGSETPHIIPSFERIVSFHTLCLCIIDVCNFFPNQASLLKNFELVCWYNVRCFGTNPSQLLKTLAEHHGFVVEPNDTYENEMDRSRRCKDVCIGVYFELPRTRITSEKRLELLQSIDIEKVRIVDSNGLRVLVKPRGENVNIRCYYQGSIAECTEFARQISENVEIATSVGDGYKYQDKINKVVENAVLIQDVKGSMQTNKKNDVKTYLLIFYGTKDGRRQSLSRISFGGKSKRGSSRPRRGSTVYKECQNHETIR